VDRSLRLADHLAAHEGQGITNDPIARVDDERSRSTRQRRERHDASVQGFVWTTTSAISGMRTRSVSSSLLAIWWASTSDMAAPTPIGKRVVLLPEPGRTGSVALDLARRLVEAAGGSLTVVSVAPQDTRICCGAGSAIDYNRAVCGTAAVELGQARKLLGPVGERASFKLLVEHKDPPLAAWIAAEGFDVVLLPARRRPLRRAKHPAAEQLRRSTSAEVRVVDAGCGVEDPGAREVRLPV
jgi:hypothetical protein